MYGIECYVTDHEGFFGKIKEKYEDFEVREIDLEGNIAQISGTKELVNVARSGENVDCASSDVVPKLWAQANTKYCEHKVLQEGSAPNPVLAPSGRSVNCSFDGSEVNQKLKADDNEGQDSKIELSTLFDTKSRDDRLSYQGSAPNRDPLPTDHSVNCRINESAVNQNLSNCDGQDNNIRAFECGDKQPFEMLSDLLDSSALAKLADSRFPDNNTQFSPSNLRNLEISLGVVDEKRVRTILHQCIRYVYPHLKTIVSKSDDKQHSEMKVIFDDAYAEFFDTGMAKEAVDDMFRFIHCQCIVNNKSTFVVKVGESKDKRTLIHRLIRQHYGSFLESKTFTSGDIVSEINVRFRSKRKVPGDTNSDSYEKSTASIYKFVLCKRNIEISDAISKLSHALKVKPSAFSFAGSKDKKAVTYQYVTTNGVDCDELEKFAAQSKGRDVEISIIEKVQHMLRLGDLSGNMFKIVMHNLQLENRNCFREVLRRIETAIANVISRGFVNYFGEQRFGFEDIPVSSADIGLAMLQGDFVKAVTLILSPTGQGGDVDHAKKYFQDTKDAAGASKRMPIWKAREACILKSLKQHGYSQYGCCQALLSVPYNVRLMYVHSYCSLLWNKMASKRIKVYGLQAIEGDLVLSSDDAESPVIVLGKEAVSRHQISDIVLPLPGFRITYPSNLLSDYEGALRDDGLEREHFRIRKVRLNVPGVYRKLLSYPKDMCWSLQNSGETGSDHRSNIPTSNNVIPQEDGNLQRGILRCDGESQDNVDLKLQFSLVSSSYATVCLREIMHNSLNKH